MTRTALLFVPLVLVLGACTKAPAPPPQIAAPAAFAPNPSATPDLNRRAALPELRGSGPRPSGATGASGFVRSPAPGEVCADPRLVLSTITGAGVGSVTWTFIVTADCDLAPLSLNIRLSTDRPTDAQCFDQDTSKRQPASGREWSDLGCSQIGYPPNNDLIEGWSFESSRVAAGTRQSRLTVVHRTAPNAPPALPEPAGLLFTWAWAGGTPTSRTWDALPILGRSSAASGDTITRLLPLAPKS